MIKVGNKVPVIATIDEILATLQEPADRRIITTSEYLTMLYRLAYALEGTCGGFSFEITLRCKKNNSISVAFFSYNLEKKVWEYYHSASIEDELQAYIEDCDLYFQVRKPIIKFLENIKNCIENA